MEGLLPITESRFSYHQLIHLVQTIRNWGPLTNSSEAAGERAIGIIKGYVPKKGGTAVDSTTIDRYIPLEKVTARDCYDFDIETFMTSNDYSYCSLETAKLHKVNLNLRWNLFSNKINGNFYFNDNTVILSKSLNKGNRMSELTEYEFDQIIDTLTHIIEEYYDNDDHERSPLYRLQTAYNHIRSKKMILVRNLSIGQMFNCITNNTLNNVINEAGADYMNRIDDSMINVITQIKNLWKSKHYAEVYVFGILLQSRGYKYRESFPPIQEEGRYGQQHINFSPSNSLNTLEKNWNNKFTYSNWCAYIDHDKTKYGLVNYFFRLNIKDDPLLHNVPLASVCTYKCDNTNRFCKLPVISIRNFPFNHEAKLFIPVTSFCSTRILSLGLDSNKLPIPVTIRYNASISEGLRRHYSTVKYENVETIILFKLNPERRKFLFERDALKSGHYTDTSKDKDFAYSK